MVIQGSARAPATERVDGLAVSEKASRAFVMAFEITGQTRPTDLRRRLMAARRGRDSRTESRLQMR
jgi:hypothetical protein